MLKTTDLLARAVGAGITLLLFVAVFWLLSACAPQDGGSWPTPQPPTPTPSGGRIITNDGQPTELRRIYDSELGVACYFLRDNMVCVTIKE